MRNQNLFSTICFILIFFGSFSLQAQSPLFSWSKSIGHGIAFETAEGYSVSTDASGNVYTLGNFTGKMDFNPGIDSFYLNGVVGSGFLQKLDAAGNFVFARCFGDSSYAKDITVDGNQNIYISGIFRGTADYDPGSGTHYLQTSSTGQYDVFVLKLDSAGNFIWARSFGNANNEEVYSVCLDPFLNVIISGQFRGTVDFNPGAGTDTLSTSIPTLTNSFLLKLDSSGSFIWARCLKGGLTASSYNITTSSIADGAGNIYSTGYFALTADFDPGTSVYTMNTVGSAEVFIQKLDAAGGFVWSRAFTAKGSTSALALSIEVDKAGNIYTGGYFQGTVDFDPGAGVDTMSVSGSDPYSGDLFMVSLNASGNFRWVRTIGGTGYESINSIALDHFANVYATGYNDSSDFNPGAGTNNLAPGTFFMKFDSAGNYVWAEVISQDAPSNAIAVDPSGGVFVTGSYSGTVDLDPGSGIYPLTSASSSAFTLKLNQSTSTGIRQYPEGNESVRVYPNPGNGQFHLTITKPGQLPATMNIYDISGKLIHHEKITSTNQQINLSGHAPGIYFYQLENGEEKKTGETADSILRRSSLSLLPPYYFL